MDLFPLNVEDLINGRSVESVRIEYKSSSQEVNKWSLIKTIAAFANDLQNLNGGFVIIGIEAADGVPELPPVGLAETDLETIQQSIRVCCKRIDPEFQPVIFPIVFEGKHILILWVPAGDNRPYRSPDDRDPATMCFHVRQGAETIKAKGEIERQLLEQTARVPYDDRRSHSGSVLDISPILVKRFLQEINSDLLNIQPQPQDVELYKSLRIVSEVQGVLIPRNIGMLFFNERPENFFSVCAFDIVQFSDDAGGNLIEEEHFSGPIDSQVLSVVEYLDSLTNVQLRKLPGKAQVERTVAYPYEALEEAIANAAYHRGYESMPEPNKVYLYPNRLEIISYPGPVPGISLQHLQGTAPIPPVPARNRRIGEFLKELRLAEMRGTGIPKIRRVMSQNGSGDPTIDFDQDRTYFRVALPAHPRYRALHALRQALYLWSIGEKKNALDRLHSVFTEQPHSGAIAAQLIEFYGEMGNIPAAESVFRTFHESPLKYEAEQPYLRLFKVLYTNNNKVKAKEIIDLLPESEYLSAPLDVAIAYKRIKVLDKSHTIFSRILDSYSEDPECLHNFAQVKIAIANELAHKRNPNWHTVSRLRIEAIELLRRSLTLSKETVQRAWCFFDLARTLTWQRAPSSNIEDAFQNAIDLLPYEKTFREGYDKWRSYNRSR
ncbi:MAG: RNA-binding domain-containing protein [Bacteroidota bacterium]|jgi:ATP-dependent DNA helicase RecG